MFFAALVVLIFYVLTPVRFVHETGRRFILSKITWVIPDEKQISGTLPKLYWKFIRALSVVEYYFGPWRQYIFGWPFVIFFVSLLVRSFFKGHPLSTGTAILGVLDVAFVFLKGFYKQNDDLKFAEFVRNNPTIHPQIFWQRYQHQLAFGAVDTGILDDSKSISMPVCDFRRGARPQLKKVLWFCSLVDTAYIAHIGLTTYRVLGRDYFCEIFDALGSLWGKQALFRAESAFELEGLENLQGLTGRNIFIFNHKSSLDFVLTFFALSHLSFQNRQFRPRFILAKDHFKDNRFMHSLLGIGLVAEAVHMIFIERKNREKSEQNLKEAALSLLQQPIDLAIYPQGTRSVPNVDRSGKRRDSGYYTTVSKKGFETSLGHLKKGTAHLVLDVLLAMHEAQSNENLNLIFVGIKGAGLALPKNILSVQTEGKIVFSVAPVVTLKSAPVVEEWGFHEELSQEQSQLRRQEFVLGLCQLIDQSLVHVLDLHEQLTQRYLTELKGQFRFEDGKIQELAERLNLAQKKQPVVFKILDCIYALPLKSWNGYLSELSQLLLERSTDRRLEELLSDVSGELLKEIHAA